MLHARGAGRAGRGGHARYARATCEGKGAYLQEQEEPSQPSLQVKHVINPWIFCSSLVSDLELDFQIHYSCNGKVSVVEHHPPILHLS